MSDPLPKAGGARKFLVKMYRVVIARGTSVRGYPILSHRASESLQFFAYRLRWVHGIMMIVEFDSATLRPASSTNVVSKIAQMLPRRFEQLLSVELAMIISRV